jgi:transcriptional regulator with XRE-family HTH domain
MQLNDIKASRTLLHWDQRQLADRAHVSVETIRRLESNSQDHSPNSKTFQKVESALRRNGLIVSYSFKRGTVLRLKKSFSTLISVVSLLRTEIDKKAYYDLSIREMNNYLFEAKEFYEGESNFAERISEAIRKLEDAFIVEIDFQVTRNSELANQLDRIVDDWTSASLRPVATRAN